MKFTLFNIILLLLLLAGCTTTNTTEETKKSAASMQDALPRSISTPSGSNYTTIIVDDTEKSPRKEMTAMIGSVKVVLNYGSPSVMGRKIWGGLEPYDEIWRTGANAATTISFSKDVTIEGQALQAGKYALFTIPGETAWTIIFNRNPDQFGAYEYKASEDVLKVVVSPLALENQIEEMEFIATDEAVLLRWDQLAVPFKVAG